MRDYAHCPCDTCGQPFKRSYVLVHRWTHTVKRPYECRVRGKWFSRRQMFKTHQLMHWKVHRRTYTYDKSYSYNVNGKSLVRKSLMTRHKRRDTSEKPHESYVCGKRFSQRRYLKVHQL